MMHTSCPARDASFADTNPILNAVTLEVNPGSSRPAEVVLSGDVTTTTFTGADAGEGLDVSGSFLYAVDIGGTGGQTVGDARFTDDSSQPGFTVSAENVIPSWGDAIQLGDSADDDALESVLQVSATTCRRRLSLGCVITPMRCYSLSAGPPRPRRSPWR